MTEHILIGIVGVIVLGIGAQWMAWRFRLPSILLLLLVGFVAGPVTRLLDPTELQGDWVFAFVSLSIGIILFEGGLSLRVSELREVGRAVLNLITIGVLVTWLLAGLGAYYVAGFNLGLAVLIGALLTVTGPTVVIPLLRHVRPTGRVGTIAKWEGITIDPVGAILAVLVLEAILLVTGAEAEGVGSALVHALEGLFLVFFISVGVSITGAALMILLLRRRLVPDYLLNPVALSLVVAAFEISNVLQEESGLLTTTLMGIFLANQPYASVRRIVEFKEDLQVLLIACLFVVLGARLELDALDYIDGPALLFLAGLILCVRPLAVAVSSLGTGLTWREQAFMAWLAPRGVVAAAVASLFAFRLREVYPVEIGGFVPVVFLVITGTVAVYGLTISPVARWLGLAQPDPQGVLFLGAHTWARRIASALNSLGFKVLLIDANVENVEEARRQGLPAERANALSESIVDEIDLAGLGRFLALTPNDEVNSLASLNFAEVFESNQIYQLAARPETRREQSGDLPLHLRGRPLFGEATTYASLSRRFNDGGVLHTVTLSEELTFPVLRGRYQDDLVLLFVVRRDELLVQAEENLITPQPGDTVLVVSPPVSREQPGLDEVAFERLIARAFVVDLEKVASFDSVVQRAAAAFSQQLPVTSDRLARGFMENARYGAMPVAHHAALLHYRHTHVPQLELGLVRCRPGLRIDFDDSSPDHDLVTYQEPVHALLFLVSSQDHPGEHLRILAHLAGRLGDEHFMAQWRAADDEQHLKEALLSDVRYVSLSLAAADETAPFIGQPISALALPIDTRVILLRRDGKLIVPDERTVLNEQDRITITGEPAGIRRLRDRYLSAVQEQPTVN